MMQYTILCHGLVSGVYPYSIVEFINVTGACEFYCDSSQGAIGCPPFSWQNGVCDSSCNTAECGYDGGDCNQLCNYNYDHNLNGNHSNTTDSDVLECDIYSSFDNGVCDVACNNSYCSFDKGGCVTLQIDRNETYCNWNSNETLNGTINIYNDYDDSDNNYGVINTSLCPTIWLADGWCDRNCWDAGRVCNYDFFDCQCDSDAVDSPCNTIYGIFVALWGDTSGVMQDDLCFLWDSLVALVTPADDIQNDETWQYILTLNCTQGWNEINENQDEYLTINEFVAYFYTYNGLTYEKAQQIDCMLCLGLQL